MDSVEDEVPALRVTPETWEQIVPPPAKLRIGGEQQSRRAEIDQGTQRRVGVLDRDPLPDILEILCGTR